MRMTRSHPKNFLFLSGASTCWFPLRSEARLHGLSEIPRASVPQVRTSRGRTRAFRERNRANAGPQRTVENVLWGFLARLRRGQLVLSRATRTLRGAPPA